MAPLPEFRGRIGCRTPVAVVCTTALVLAGCSNEARRNCASLAEAAGMASKVPSPEESHAITDACTQAFEETHDPWSGVTAAKADVYAGRYDEALAWLDRLRGTPEEAGAWSVAAAVHQMRGDATLERAAHERAVQLHVQAGNHREAARSYYRLFLVAYRGADLRQQLECLRLAFEHALRAGHREMQATVVQALMSPLLEIGDLNSTRRVLQTARGLVSPENRVQYGLLLNLEGILHATDGQTALALDAFKRALTLLADGGSRSTLRSIYLDLVEASVRAGHVEEAAQYLDKAWTYAEPDREPKSLLYYRAFVNRARRDYAAARIAAQSALAGDTEPDLRWRLEQELGLALEGLGQRAAAEAAFERAAAHVEELRRSLDLDDFKFWLLDQRREPYEALFRLQARGGRARKAVETLERARARTFLDALVRATTTSGVGSADVDLLRASAERFDTLQALLPAMSRSPAAEVSPIDDVLSATAGRHILAYFEAGDEFWLVAFANSRIRLHRLSAHPRTVRELTERVLALPDEPAAAAALADILLPATALPAPGGVLYIITDGPLGRVPFAALRPRGQFLVQDYVVSYAPSLNALHAADQRADVAYGPAVVLGDPRGDLPAAALEATEVARRLSVTPHVGAAATKDRLAGASRARLLHLATHTGIGPRGPWLAVAEGEIDASMLLTAALKPRLVVLATCASAAQEGRGMWGSLGATFLAAGSQAVLAALWSVGDPDAREFIMRFYEAGGLADPAAALARTQRAFIASGKPASFWAPYVHFGS